MEYIKINRDPFGRYDTVRRTVETSDGCAWCGNHRKSGRMFQYGNWPDDKPKPYFDDRVFDCIGCFKAYHG